MTHSKQVLHVFYVHSNVTFGVIREIISTYSIEPENSIFILKRNFNHPYLNDKRTIDLSDYYLEYKARSIISNLSITRQVNKIFKPVLSNEKYLLYLPHFKIHFFNSYIKYGSCEGINIVEEGLLAYRKKEVMMQQKYHQDSALVKAIKRLAFKAYSGYPAAYIEEKHRLLKNFYAISEYAFKDFKNRIVLSNAFVLSERLPKKLFYIFSVPKFHQMEDRSIESYLGKLGRIFKKISEDFKLEITLKLHPQMFNQPKLVEKINEIIQNIGVPIDQEEDDNQYSMEEYIRNSDSIFVGTHSSVLIYAALFEAQVYSDYDYLYQDNSFWLNFPTEITERIRFLPIND